MSMGLSGKQSSGERTPYFIKEAIVMAVDVEYNKPNNEGETKDVDCVVTMQMDKKDGGTFESKLFLSGNYKKDTRGDISGWGRVFLVKNLINACGIEDFETDKNGVIPVRVWQKIIEDKPKVLVLSYVTKQGEKGLEYRKYGIVDKDRKKLEERFLKEAASDYGVYEYHPELIDGGKAAPTSNDEVPF